MRTRLAAAALPLAAASALGLAAAAPAHAGGGTAADPRLQHPYHVVITVTDSGEDDGTYELYCDPVSGLSYGQHPEPGAACDALLSSGQPFEPVSSDALCTYMYGGPALRHLGRRAGRGRLHPRQRLRDRPVEPARARSAPDWRRRCLNRSFRTHRRFAGRGP